MAGLGAPAISCLSFREPPQPGSRAKRGPMTAPPARVGMTRQRYVIPLMFPFDPDQSAARPPAPICRLLALPGGRHEESQRPRDRPPRRLAHEAVEIWTVALWLLAMVFLLTTVQVY